MVGTRSAYRSWLKRFSVVMVILLGVVALFNILVDGVGVFRLNSGLKYMAENLVKGKMIAGSFGRYGERELQRLVVEAYPGRRDLIAIGSSRLMMLRGRFIKGNPDFFNHSVSGASMEDLLAIIGVYKEKGLLPRRVVLGIDPWILDKKTPFGDRWKTLDHYYQLMLSEIGTPKPDRTESGWAGSKSRMTMEQFLAQYQQLINLDCTLQNWESLKRGRKLRVTTTVDIDDFVREPDGSLHFPYVARFGSMKDQLSQAAVSPKVAADAANGNSLDGLDKLESLVRFLHAHSVQVVFVLPPFSPTAYHSCLNDAQHCSMLGAEIKVRNLAQRNGVPVLGSYNPGVYGFEGKDFFDATHGHEVVMKRLFSEYTQ
jgi:hypothetical protein